MDLDWLDLPEHLWIKILQQVDVKTLLNISETCSTLNNLLCDTILIKKLFLLIDLRREYLDIYLNIFKHSNRKYRKVVYWSFSTKALPSADFEVMFEILNHFSGSIREIQIDGFNISCSNWNRLIKTLKYVEIFESISIRINRSPTGQTGIEKSAFKIETLLMSRVFLGQLDIFDGTSVNKLALKDKYINQYIPFLKNHEELKGLRVDICEMFVDDNLSNVKFSLEYLDLTNARWSNKQYALNFIRTQTELQTVYLKIHMNQYDILFLKHIINNNRKLKKLFIDIAYFGYLLENDLDQIETNLSVTECYFVTFPQEIELSEKIYRLFPNLNNNYFDYLGYNCSSMMNSLIIL